MSHSLLALFLCSAIALFLVKSQRDAYFYPIEILESWHSYMPRKDWSRKLIRGFSVFWVFGGIMVIENGVVPFLQKYHWPILILALVGIAGAGTALLLRWQPKPNSESIERR